MQRATLRQPAYSSWQWCTGKQVPENEGRKQKSPEEEEEEEKQEEEEGDREANKVICCFAGISLTVAVRWLLLPGA